MVTTKIFILVLGIQAVLADVVKINTNIGLERVRKSKIPHAVFYYHHHSEETLKSKMVNVMLEADETMTNNENPFINLFKVNCEGKRINKSEIEECNQGRRIFYAYRENKREKFDLKTLYDTDAFLGHMLYFVYDEDIGIAQSKTDWEYEQNQQKGKKDIILMYFLGLGTKEQYHFMNFASKYLDAYKFVYSTDRPFAESLGMSSGDEIAIWYVQCSEAKDTNLPCKRVKYHGTSADTTALASFVKMWNVPLISEMNEDGSTLYDNIHRLYIFVDNKDSKSMFMEMVTHVINMLTTNGIHLRGVIVDKQKHSNLLADYGIYENSFLPTIMLEIHGNKHSADRELEPFTLDTEFNIQSIYQFTLDLISGADERHYKNAQFYDIQSVHLSEWEKPKPGRKALAAGCSNDAEYDTMCRKFNVNFRRLVRTMFDYDVIDYEYSYVDFTNKPKSAKSNGIPMIHLFKSDQSVVESAFGPDSSYLKMLEWINHELGLDLKPIPLSGSDFIPLPTHSDFDENAENLLGDEDQLSSMQDDEISKDATSDRGLRFYEDNVTLLTDVTFKKTVAATDLLVVLFFVPWDDASYMFQPVYARVVDSLAVDSTGSTIETKLAKVDCYDAHQSCKEQHAIAYPLIRFFRNGKAVGDYKGMMDQKNLIKSVRIYQQPPLLYLDNQNLIAYTKGQHPMPTAAFADVSVLAYFEKAEGEKFEIYKRFAEKHYGLALFGYHLPDTLETLKSIGEHPGVQAFVRTYRPDGHDFFNEPYNESELDKFLVELQKPAFDELTASNFPSYKAFGQPIFIIFTKITIDEESTPMKVIGKVMEMIKPTLKITWMSMDKPVTRSIRRSYLGKSKGKDNEMVIVDHKKGTVYAYLGPTDDTKSMMKGMHAWLKKFTKGTLEPTSYLSQPKWKPIRNGFDYLHYIEHGVPRGSLEEYDENDEDSAHVLEEVGNYGHYKPSDRAVFHGKVAPKSAKEFDSSSYYNDFDEHSGDIVSANVLDSLDEGGDGDASSYKDFVKLGHDEF